jgi:hypothetical protein
MRNKIMPPCDIHNPHTRLKAFSNDTGPHVIRPAAVPTPTRFNNLAATNKPITTICHAHPPNDCAQHLADPSGRRNIPNQWGLDGAYSTSSAAARIENNEFRFPCLVGQLYAVATPHLFIGCTLLWLVDAEGGR